MFAHGLGLQVQLERPPFWSAKFHSKSAAGSSGGSSVRIFRWISVAFGGPNLGTPKCGTQESHGLYTMTSP